MGFLLAAMLLVWLLMTRTDDLREGGSAATDTVAVTTAGPSAP